MDPRTHLETLLVHADSLEAEGRAQGGLISLQWARQQAPFGPRATAQKQQEVDLIAKHRHELFGQIEGLEGLDAAWRLGFIDELSLELRTSSDLEALSAALTLPSFAGIERLHLTIPALDDFSFFSSLPASLRHLSVAAPPDFEWPGLLGGLSALASLSLSGGATLDFEGLSLPRLRSLRLGFDFEHLTREVVPKLERLRASRPPLDTLDLPGLELFFVDEDLADFEPLPGLRVVNEDLSPYAEAGDTPGVLFRCGPGFGGERAFVLSDAPREAVQRIVSTFEVAHGLTAGLAEVQLGHEQLVIVELREETSNDGALLRRTAQLLARDGHRVVEVACSASHHEFIAWWVEASRTRPLVMGPFKERVQLFRRAIDQSFGFDAGNILDDVLLALDAKQPIHLRGPVPGPGFEWPITTTFPPQARADHFDSDQDEEEAAPQDAPFDPLDFRDKTSVTDWWIAPVVEEAVGIDSPPVDESAVAMPGFEREAADDDDGLAQVEPGEELTFDAATADWDEVMNEGPVDPEEDGLERNPEYGLEPDAFDPDSVDSTALSEDPPPEECAVCAARRPLRQCRACRNHVCAACAVPPGADDQVLCEECPRPTRTSPVPKPPHAD